MPLVGSVTVRGLKKKDVELKIAEALQAKYVNNPNVSVNVKEYKSRQISLLGMVKSPGPYYIMSQRTLLQLLSEAGGLAAGAGNKAYVFRPGSPKIEINLYELMNNGNPELNITKQHDAIDLTCSDRTSRWTIRIGKRIRYQD
jgi:polysaccharide export outer membrane protein